jgi:acyl-CoA synthetase (AMP-forming)/AMP-acid ligase II
VVVTEPGSVLDGDTVRDYARARLRGSSTPDAVVFRTGLPHTPTGKLIRRDLVRDVLATQTTA